MATFEKTRVQINWTIDDEIKLIQLVMDADPASSIESLPLVDPRRNNAAQAQKTRHLAKEVDERYLTMLCTHAKTTPADFKDKFAAMTSRKKNSSQANKELWSAIAKCQQDINDIKTALGI